MLIILLIKLSLLHHLEFLENIIGKVSPLLVILVQNDFQQLDDLFLKIFLGYCLQHSTHVVIHNCSYSFSFNFTVLMINVKFHKYLYLPFVLEVLQRNNIPYIAIFLDYKLIIDSYYVQR